eukprot:4150467-Amphidinium_carterae.1
MPPCGSEAFANSVTSLTGNLAVDKCMLRSQIAVITAPVSSALRSGRTIITESTRMTTRRIVISDSLRPTVLSCKDVPV